MKRGLEEWIAALPEGERAKDAPPYVFAEHGMRITLSAWPRHNWEQVGRAIGVRHFPVSRVEVYNDIRSALEKKASRYGELDHPYAVAISTPETFPDEENAMVALLGTRCVVVSRLPDVTERVEEGRNADGIWIGRGGPRKRGLSAVLVTRSIDPWNFAARIGCLIRNPWALAALPQIRLGTDELNPRDGQFHRTEGEKFEIVFALPKDWPGY